jgi:hypothetical protein
LGAVWAESGEEVTASRAARPSKRINPVIMSKPLRPVY